MSINDVTTSVAGRGVMCQEHGRSLNKLNLSKMWLATTDSH